MKLKFLLILLVASMSVVKSQDVGISQITFPSDDSLTMGSQTVVTFTLTNFGTVDIQSGETIPIEVDFFGSTGTINLPLQQTLAAGASGNVTTSNLLTIPTVTPGAYNLCLTTKYPSDIDSTNDGTCRTYQLKTGSVSSVDDLGIVQIFSPVDSVLIIGQVTDSLKVSIANFGNTNITQNDTVSVFVSAFGITLPELILQLPQGQVFPPNASVELNLGPLSLVPGTPLGLQEICIWTKWSKDQNNSNDTTCRTFNIVNNVGIAELTFDPQVNFYNNILYLKLPDNYQDNHVNAIITDATGRLMKKETLTAGVSREYDFSDYASGMYILTVYSSEGRYNRKFIKH